MKLTATKIWIVTLLTFLNTLPKYLLAEVLQTPEQTPTESAVGPRTSPETQRKYFPTVSFGLPVPMNVGAYYTLNSMFKLLLTAGYAPVPFLLNGSYRAGNLEMQGLWHPFEGPLFFSSGLGYQTLQYHTTLSLGSLSGDLGPVPSTAMLNCFYASVNVGYLWKISSRLSLGADLGITIPLISNGGLVVDSSSNAGSSLQSASQNALGYFATYVLPRITLIRLGWLF